MAMFTTGPVARGADTDRIQVLAKNNSRHRSIIVVVSVLGDHPGFHHHWHHRRGCRCSSHHRYYHRHQHGYRCDGRSHYYRHRHCRCHTRNDSGPIVYNHCHRGHTECSNKYGHEHYCPCPCCNPSRRSRRRKFVGTYRRLYRRRRWIMPGRTVTFDIDLWDAHRYEVRLRSLSSNVLYYVTGYRPGRWWHEPIHDPSTTFRHTQLIRLC